MDKKEQPCLLLMETATEVCSVSVARGRQILAIRESVDGVSHSRNLIPFIEEVLTEAGLEKTDIDAISLGIGPGSYTGLRIGASVAKGMAYALDLPVITVSTLYTIMKGAKNADIPLPEDAPKLPLLYIPMIDARRMEVYMTSYDNHGNRLEEVKAMVVVPGVFDGIGKDYRIVFCGSGMPKCREILEVSPHAFFSESPVSSVHMLDKTLQKFEDKIFADIAYFEPYYLKEYVAAKSHVKGLQ